MGLLRFPGCACRTAAKLAASFLGLAVLAGCSSSTNVSQGPNPAVSFAPGSLNFGTVGLGASSTGQSVVVTNSGTAALTINSIAATGDFSLQGNNCGSSLPSGSTCTLSAVFTPTVTGARTGTISLSTNASGSPQTVALSGMGGTSQSTLSTTALTFGSTMLGNTSAVQTVTVSSGGTAPLTLGSITVTGDFVQTANTCTATLAAGSTCTVSVAFKPSATGVRTGNLTIASNVSSTPQTVSLTGTGTPSTASSGAAFQATVLAGTQPVAGAAVQLYAAGSSGNGSAGSALLAGTVLTASNGVVQVAAGYSCPAANSLLYLVASGGTVGAATAANPNLRLVTAIGPCGGIVSGAKYTANEATTVALGYALAQFSGGGFAIGATSTNVTGLTNAFATAGSLADTGTGSSPGSTLPANATLPVARINSVANMVNVCAVSASACGGFFSATATSALTPTNTLDAVFNLAKNPAANIVTLYGQSLLSKAYAPALTAIPADWTMFVTSSGGGMNTPSTLAVDSTGSVWVANYFYTASKFTPLGAPVFASGVMGGGLSDSYGLAIDLNDNAWIPNELPSSVTQLSPAGAILSGSGGYTNGGLSYPLSAAIDPNGTVWLVDYGDSHVTLLNLLGTPLSGTDGYTTPKFAFPVAVALDSNHFGWVTNQSDTTVTKVAPDGSSFTNYDCCVGPSGVALDQGNNVWVANFYGDSVSLISSAGMVLAKGTFTGAGSMTRPQGIAIDGNGNVWVANFRQPYLTEIAGVNASSVGQSISPSTGLGADAALLEAYALAIDASGNIWVSNQGSNTITKFIGMAAPVKTPLSALPKQP